MYSYGPLIQDEQNHSRQRKDQLTFNIIGNCPRLNFSLMTTPFPYWKQTSAKSFPEYEIFACLHCFKNMHSKNDIPEWY